MNIKIHGCLEIPYLFLVLNMISQHDIMFNTRNEYGISAQPCIIFYLVNLREVP